MSENERIPDPVGDDLRPVFSQERTDMMWRRITAARDGESENSARRTLRSPVFALAAAACVMAGGILLVRELQKPAELIAAGNAPLTQRDGHAIVVIAPQTSGASVALSDGSELRVDKGGVLAPLDVSDRSVVLHLLRGRSSFAVKPGGPRRWVVEAGVASVEVVGTRFSVDRDAGGVVVQVEEGKVLVRSSSLQDGVARLAAGESLRVPAKVAEAVEGPGMEPALEGSAAVPAEGEKVAGVEPAVEPSAADVAVKKAPALVIKPAVVQPAVLDADALFAIADDARMTRDYRGAIVALERVIREHAQDPRAKLAAFTIGRLRDEHLHDLSGATSAYEQALSLGLSGSLAEDCYSRLMRVLSLQAMKGHVARERVERAAQQYLQRYPKGRYAAEARGVVQANSAR